MNYCHNLMIFAQKDEFNLASILQYKIRFDASDFFHGITPYRRQVVI